MVQVYIGKILAQSNISYFLQPLIFQALLHIIIQNTLCRYLITFPIHILQRKSHLFRPKLIFINN